MAWTTPGTAVAGNVLTAAQWNSDVRDNSLMGNPVFTNEAARDAAITSPVEGQSVYLTSPTIPAATGLTTAIPTGIKTIYNGAQWVCVSEVAAMSDASTASAAFSTGFTNLTFGGTAISVTLVTGTTAVVSIAATIGATAGKYDQINIKTGTVGSNNLWGAYNQASSYNTVSRTFVMHGLTAGTNTFTMTCQANSAGDTANQATLFVKGIA